MEWGPILVALFGGGITGMLGAVAALRKANADAEKNKIDSQAAVLAGYDTLVNQLQEQVAALSARVTELEKSRKIDEEIIIRQSAEIALLRGRVTALEARLRAAGINPDEIGGVPV